uniref:BLOC-1-related complex subunit 7 n=1 Tax=Ascaris lumbricoides TaxID=6252 RepID=A0A0M3IBM4_ASCLU
MKASLAAKESISSKVDIVKGGLLRDLLTSSVKTTLISNMEKLTPMDAMSQQSCNGQILLK